MGGICTRAENIKTTYAAAPSAETREQPNAHDGAADGKPSHTPLLAAASSQRSTGPTGSADPQEHQKRCSDAPTTDLDSFTMGEGCGVYLVEQKSLNGMLVTEYAKECPAEEEGIVLLQIKPPPYRPIPEIRFTLQGGKRVLKQNITATTKDAAGQAKYCAMVLDFARLADTYKGFLWASSHLDEALQPFSLFIVGTKKRSFAPGSSAVLHANDEEQVQQRCIGAGTVAQRKTGENGQDKGAGGEGDRHEQKQPSDGVKEDLETEGPNDSGNGCDKDTLYVQYLEAQAAFSYRLLDRCGILPVPLVKAKEIIPPWSKVESMESFQKMVIGAGGAFFSKTTTS